LAAVFLLSRLVAAPSYGPPTAADLRPTLAPGVVAEVIPSHRSLGALRFEDFDVSPDGAIAVVSEGRLLDLLGGEELVPRAAGVRSAAFAGGALAIADGAGQIGYLDEGGFVPAGPSPVRSPRLAPSADRSRLLIFATTPAYTGGGEGAVADIASGQPAEIRAGAAEALLAAAADDEAILFSIGDCLFRQARGDTPRLILKAPRPDATIVGLALAGGEVLFSTPRAVYALLDGLALPLAIGVGGPLRVHEGAIYVLDAATGRIFRIRRGASRSPAPRATPAPEAHAPSPPARAEEPPSCPLAPWDDETRGWSRRGSTQCGVDAAGGFYLVVVSSARGADRETAMSELAGAWRRYLDRYHPRPCPAAREMVYFNRDGTHGAGILFAGKPPGWDEMLDAGDVGRVLRGARGDPVEEVCFFRPNTPRPRPGW
jgi:hypothetical protein